MRVDEGDVVNLPPDTRVSISLSTLRAELGQLELRLVDRLNGALVNKADRAVLDQVVARQSEGLSRLNLLEANTVKREGPIVRQIEEHEKAINDLRAISGYKKWLWAQTVALIGVAVAVMGVWLSVGSPS